jgi:hypothetical protein
MAKFFRAQPTALLTRWRLCGVLIAGAVLTGFATFLGMDAAYQTGAGTFTMYAAAAPYGALAAFAADRARGGGPARQIGIVNIAVLILATCLAYYAAVSTAVYLYDVSGIGQHGVSKDFICGAAAGFVGALLMAIAILVAAWRERMRFFWLPIVVTGALAGGALFYTGNLLVMFLVWQPAVIVAIWLGLNWYPGKAA